MCVVSWYCWWLKSEQPVEGGSLPDYLSKSYASQVVQDFFYCIHSILLNKGSMSFQIATAHWCCCYVISLPKCFPLSHKSSLKLLYTFNTQTRQVAFHEIGPTLVDTPKRYWNKLLDIKTFVEPAWSQINVYQILKTITTFSWVFSSHMSGKSHSQTSESVFLEKSPKMIRGLRSPKTRPSVSCSKDEEHFPMILPGP